MKQCCLLLGDIKERRGLLVDNGFCGVKPTKNGQLDESNGPFWSVGRVQLTKKAHQLAPLQVNRKVVRNEVKPVAIAGVVAATTPLPLVESKIIRAPHHALLLAKVSDL